jgi:hypothetical protein
MICSLTEPEALTSVDGAVFCRLSSLEGFIAVAA